jgi:hypothetical protein
MDHALPIAWHAIAAFAIEAVLVGRSKRLNP